MDMGTLPSHGPTSLDRLVDSVAKAGIPEGLNLVAFSGGVDSSLTAFLVHEAFGERAQAAIGLSAALPEDQLALARRVAKGIGIELKEIQTHEGDVPGYIANAGDACFYCKTTLYGTLQEFAEKAVADLAFGRQVMLYNGTNKDDLRDPTRVGLKAARDFKVASPLEHLTKAEVRAFAKEAGLPNWAYAASPCLRSRLAFGVEATQARLKRVEAAEAVVRQRLSLDVRDNLRVRVIDDERAVLELDGQQLEAAEAAWAPIEEAILALGFKEVQGRVFRSGSLSGAPSA